jgi:hypothetical protein
MADILKAFTPDQLFDLGKNYVISKDVGLTNYNSSSDTRAILEAVGAIVATVMLDMVEAIRKAIPTTLYTPLNFSRKPAISSTGELRFYRLPIFYIQYSGSDISVKLNITTLQLTLTTLSTPSDDVTVDFATFDTIDKVVTEIESKTNWSAIKIQNGEVNDLYLYSNKEIIANKNYLLLNNTVDVMYKAAPLVSILSGVQASGDGKIFLTTTSGTIDPGNATSEEIGATSIQTGVDSNIEEKAIDTIEGKGFLNTPVAGVEHVINDNAFVNGSNEETTEEQATRFITFVNGLHGGTKLGIEKDILDILGIKAVSLRERFPRDGINTIIADDGTGNLPGPLQDEILKVIKGDINDSENYPGKGVAGITYNIEPPIVRNIDIDATLFRIGTISDEDELKNNAELQIAKYINTRKSGGDVVHSKVVSIGQESSPGVYSFKVTEMRQNGFPVVVGTDVSVPDGEIARTGAGTSGIITITIITLSAIP